jgi:hypothetical protein
VVTTCLTAALTAGFAVAEPAGASGRIAFSLPEGRLERLGLSVTGTARTVAPATDLDPALEPPVFVFALDEGGGDLSRVARGGFALRAEDPATGRGLPPALLYDFAVEIDRAAEEPVTLRSVDPDLPVPIEVRNAALRYDEAKGALVMRWGDLVVSHAWAERLGRAELAGAWIGSVDIELPGVQPERADVSPRDGGQIAATPGVDIELAELYSLTEIGRDVPYPNGSGGLSAATTSCNPGSVPVRWQLETVNGPLIEEHPFIGLALYRLDANGALEMIGKNWIKHGFFATNNNDCFYGCTAAANSLGVGCADTYAVGHNGATFYLGPREEVNPHTASWTACGSFFDGTPVDCKRNWLGGGFSEVEHRLEAWDDDLGLPGARYFYEGVYYVQGDQNIDNNIGWKECIVTWANLWVFSDINPVPGWTQKDTDGALIATWGDQQVAVPAAADDGTLWFAVKVDSLGGGQWHYEYAVYNYTSARGLFSFAVPTGTANITNVGFHDVDHDSSTDWTPLVTPGLVTWRTDDWVTDPAAPALGYQSLFNFRFDADAAPVASTVLGGLFAPGVGTSVSAGLLAPAAAATAALPGPAVTSAFALLGVEPNPMRGRATVSFSLDRDRVVRLSVVDVSGRTLRVLREGTARSGRGSATWDGLDANGSRAAAGVYFFRLESEGTTRTKKVALLR